MGADLTLGYAIGLVIIERAGLIANDAGATSQ